MREQNLMHYGRLVYCLGLTPAYVALGKIHQFHHLKNGIRFVRTMSIIRVNRLAQCLHTVSLQQTFAVTVII